jgi:hypothetical protein
MSQLIEQRPVRGDAGPRPHDSGRGRRLVMAIVVLGLLLGAVAGWSAFAMLSSADPADRSVEAQQARWEAAAEQEAARAAAEARRLDIERQRWEARADHFAPGWRAK